MSWIIPENRLGPEPRIIIDGNLKQNICIKGIAGTGKTLVLMHLVRKVMHIEPNIRICVLAYNNLIVEHYRMGFDELCMRVNVMTYYSFTKSSQNYDYIFCDNIQNISSKTLVQISSQSKYVIVTIDPYIKLFATDPLTNELTLSICEIISLLTPKVYDLFTHNYCSSKRILISKVLRINLYQGINSISKIDTQVRICKAKNDVEELQYIYRYAKRGLKVGNSSSVLLPTHDLIMSFIQSVILLEGKQPWTIQTNKYGKTDYSVLNCYLEKNGLPIQCLGNGYGHLSECQNKISISTYYSSLGLQFDDVYIPYVNSNMYINSDEQISRNALALAMTRCRYSLYITYTGKIHEYLKDAEADCCIIDIHEALSSNSASIFKGF